jgi:hypothetical protein
VSTTGQIEAFCRDASTPRKRRGFPGRFDFGFWQFRAFSSEVDTGSREENA